MCAGFTPLAPSDSWMASEMAWICRVFWPGHDHEVIGEPLRRAEIEHHHVARLAVVPGVNGALNLSRKLPGGAFAWRSHRTAATGAGTYK